MGSFNPFKYKPAQLAKALIAILGGLVTICASQVLGTWGVVFGATVLTPALVFLVKARPWIEALDTAGRHAE